jgi:3-oxoacyl-[acyl-carrier-protein] synthase II
MGIISPLGLDVSSTWQAITSGESGVGPIESFDTSESEIKIAAEVRGFDPKKYLGHKESRHMDRFTQFAMAASFEATAAARIDGSRDMTNTGVIIGSGIGGQNTLTRQLEILNEKGERKVNPYLIPMMLADSASGNVSMFFRAKGPNFCTTSACSSSSDAIGEAYEIIKRGDASIMITGGSEAAIIPIGVSGFRAVGALSSRNDRPKQASRPFDADRDGFVMAEGAAILILESLPSAVDRGAKILAEVIGYGASSDAFHITQPDETGEGGARAMRRALEKAGLQPSQIDYINAHGTSTRLNDKVETMCLKTVFGEDAHRIPISSTKSMTGHLLGAAGALEAALSVLTIQHGILPPTINLDTPDPECDLDYVPKVARKAKVRTVLSNTLGFGGHNSVLIFREYTGEGS